MFGQLGVSIAMLFHRKPMDTEKRPAFDENHAAPLIQILTWLGLAFSSLSIIAHFSTKKAMSRPTTKGDIILLLALVSRDSIKCAHMADRVSVVPGHRASGCFSESCWPGDR
jgi:hypothetical protein